MKKLLLFMLMAAAGLQGWADDWFINGDATPMGWSDDAAKHQVTAFIPQGNGTYVWIGKLVVGSEGFKIGKSADLGGWGDYHPSTGGLAINTVEEDNIVQGGGDTKWKVSQDGVYKLTLTEGTPNKLKCEAYTPSITQEDGYYLINTAADLYEFAELVSHKGIAANANAKLTADIDYTAYPRSTIGRHRDIAWAGTFDGQGHKIKIALTDWMQRTGLFSYVYHPTIKDLWIDGTITMSSHNCAGGLGGRCDGDGPHIDGILSTVAITDNQSGDGTHGGLFANIESNNATISNCAFFGSINAQSRDGNGGLVGWCGSGSNVTFKNCLIAPASISWNGGAIVGRNTPTVTNCYYYNISNNGDFSWANGSTLTEATAETLASGEVCYNLNEKVNGAKHWYQTLPNEDTKPYPLLLGHKKVYANGEMDCGGNPIEGGTVTYSNSSSSELPPHSFDGGNGWCTVCGAVNANYLTADSEGFYSIGNANDLNWFADIVDKVEWQAKAKLTANIDYTAYQHGYIGKSQSNSFGGIFDGQEHTITIDMVNNGIINRTALFAYIYGATIKNLIVEGSSTSAGNNCVGGLGGRADNTTTIENVIVKTNVSYTGTNGDATCGGILANAEGDLTIKNCAFLGSINTGTAEGNGGLVGYANSGNRNVYENCLVAPTEYTKNGNSAEFARNNPSTTNCHYTSANDAKLASGELCYTLNDGGDNWYQNLTGTVDVHPVPFSSHSKVYANAHFDCGGNAMGAVVYGNDNNEIHDAHQEGEDGFCSVCDLLMTFKSNFMTPVDGYYEISNNKELCWFAAKVNTEDPNVNARLMNDIDMAKAYSYTPIGKDPNNKYNGTFDGQGFRIKNLTIANDNKEQGLFSVCENATIKNLTMDATCSITCTGKTNAAFVGVCNGGGTLTFENCGNEATVTGSGANNAAFLAFNYCQGNNLKVVFKNCYNTGKVSGGWDNCAFIGWNSSSTVTFDNCWNIGTIENVNGDGNNWARSGSDKTLTNCYSTNSTYKFNGALQEVTTAQVADGTLCAKVGFGFRQNIGEGGDAHPNFDKTHGFVAQISGAGYSTMYNVYSDVTIPSGIEAFGGKINANSITLLPADGKIKAGEPVVLEGTAGLYNFMPTTGAEAIADNELLGSDGTVKGENIYALAKPEGEDVGFYRVNNTVTIPEGRVYFVKNAGVKGYTFDNEDGATAIEMVNGQSSMVNEIYNLAGQRINKVQKGINIINGKKVLF